MSPMVSTPTLPFFDSNQSGMDSIILDNPFDQASTVDPKSGPFFASGKPSEPTVTRYYLKDSVDILYASEPNGGVSVASRACVLCKRCVVDLLCKLGSAGVSAVLPAGKFANANAGESVGGVRDPAVDADLVESSVASGEGVTGTGLPSITNDEFQRGLAEVPCLSLSMHVGMMGEGSAASGLFGCRADGDGERQVREVLAELTAKIEAEVVEEGVAEVDGAGRRCGAVGAEEAVLINVSNNLDGEGEGYIETVEGEGDDGGEPAVSHCGVQFNTD